MKIGIDIRSIGANRTGDEVYIMNLVRSLAKIDKENQYFLFTDQTPKKLKKIRKEIFPNQNQGKNFLLVSILPKNKALWTFFALPIYLWKNPVDILHVQYIVPFLLPIKAKIITTIHDISFNFFPQYIKKSDLFFLKTLIPLSLRKAKKIIGVSEFTARAIKTYYKIVPEKVVAINNGGASEEFFQKISEEKKEAIRQKYFLKEKYLLSVGTLQPRKNIPFLMKSFLEFKIKYAGRKEVENLLLAIGGNRKATNFDKEIEKTEKEISKKYPQIAPKIKFLGFIPQEDLPALYQSAEVFVFPSLYEGFGLPLLEAMASETPVLCSNSSCFPEIAGNGAELFLQNDKKDFTKKLFSIIIDKSKKTDLKTKGLKRVGDFSWEKCARETLSVYQSIG